MYDVECDTTTASPHECAVQIKEFRDSGQVPGAFGTLRLQLLAELTDSTPGHHRLGLGWPPDSTRASR